MGHSHQQNFIPAMDTSFTASKVWAPILMESKKLSGVPVHYCGKCRLL
jgi:hypothetical protein